MFWGTCEGNFFCSLPVLHLFSQHPDNPSSVNPRSLWWQYCRRVGKTSWSWSRCDQQSMKMGANFMSFIWVLRMVAQLVPKVSIESFFTPAHTLYQSPWPPVLQPKIDPWVFCGKRGAHHWANNGLTYVRVVFDWVKHLNHGSQHLLMWSEWGATCWLSIDISVVF